MKKFFSLLLISIMAVFLISGCGNQTSSSSNDNSGKITLRVLNWGSTAEKQIADDAIKRFEKVHPNVQVDQTIVPVNSWSDFIQKWITMRTSGESPDIINIGLEATQMAVKNNLIQPIDSIVNSDKTLSSLKTEYAPSLLNGFTVSGKLYGLPNGAQTMVMYFNKKIFDAAGVPYPKDGWTWSDFKNTAEKLTKSDKSVYGYGLASAFFQLTPWFTTNSAYPITGDGKPALNSNNMIQSVEFLKTLVDEKVTPDPISSDVYTMFASKKLAMVGAGRWVLNTWKEAGLTSADFDFVQWPVNTQDSSVYGGAAWTLGSDTKNKNIATDLLKEMVSTETLKAVAKGGQQIPPTQALATSSEIMGTTPDNINGLWKAITISKPVAAPTYFGDLEQTSVRSMQKIFSGNQNVKTTLDDAQSQVEKAINK